MTIDTSKTYAVDGAVLNAVIVLTRKGCLYDHAMQIEAYLSTSKELVFGNEAEGESGDKPNTEAKANG